MRYEPRWPRWIEDTQVRVRRDRVARAIVAFTLLLPMMLLAPGSPAQAQTGEAIVAGELRLTPTMDHIGVMWFVAGDTDQDSAMRIEYRQLGDTQWRDGAPAVRAEPNVIVDGAPLGRNTWAASAMFLERGTAYEIRAWLSDPDGGSVTRTGQTTTRTLPVPGSNQRYVAPGSSGGSGTQADPFRGLQTAADNASPGDTFVVASGVYGPFTLRTSGTANAPISFTAADGGTAIIDGSDTSRGVITLEAVDHVILSGLTIGNGAWGIDAQHTSHLVISDNTITDVDFGVYNRRDADRERYQVVCDNVIEGRTVWPGTGIPGERGIDLRGWGHTVCNNRVSNFGDCVSVQPLTGDSFGNDIFGNDANQCVDDGIEVDYNQANVRVYRNRVSNSRIGVSVQPIAGGPAYIFRNELFNLENSTIKLNNGPSGLFVAHNTGVKLENALEDGSVFTNTVLRNNVFIGTRYAFEFNTTEPQSGSRDFDHNAWGSLRTGNSFKWDGVRYATVADLPPGVEDHGLEVDLSALNSATLPTAWTVEVPPGSQNLRPSTSSPIINAGTAVTNLNEPFVTDGLPDSGALEFGQPRPVYGPGTPLIPAATSELVRNGDFSARGQQWFSRGSNTRATTGELCTTALATASDPADAQLAQFRLPVVRGATYRLTFAIRATTSATIGVAVQFPRAPRTPVMSESVAVSGSRQTHSIEFVADRTIRASHLVFSLGTGVENRYCIDDVSLQRTGEFPRTPAICTFTRTGNSATVRWVATPGDVGSNVYAVQRNVNGQGWTFAGRVFVPRDLEIQNTVDGSATVSYRVFARNSDRALSAPRSCFPT